MIETEVEFGTTPELTADMIRGQLDLLVRDEVFRSSKRSVAFLKYVVEQTLNGSADQIKERTIGVEVFGRDPSYDTNLDHIVRTAATELRKRLATYYVDEKHRSELRMGLVPGSYIPRFTLPEQAKHPVVEPGLETDGAETTLETRSAHIQFAPLPLPAAGDAADQSAKKTKRRWIPGAVIAGVAFVVAVGIYAWLHQASPEDLFWKPGARYARAGPAGSWRSSEWSADSSGSERERECCHASSELRFVGDGSFCGYGDDCESGRRS